MKECGYDEALLGLSLSHGSSLCRMPAAARKLARMDGGHNKFLESIVVWLDIRAPRYWWQQFDAYRVGVTKQSESTMHTLLRRPISQEDFESPIHPDYLRHLERLREEKRLYELKCSLPEGYLQRRLVCANYKSLRNIHTQRKSHELAEWRAFCEVVDGLEHWRELFG